MTAFKVITALCLLVLLYAGFEWGRLSWQAHDAASPSADFMVLAKGKGPRITAFIDYRCNNCASVYKALDDLRELHPDITLIIRPLYYADPQSEKFTRLALSAGLSGKFAEVHEAFSEANGRIDERFLRETLSLYGLDETELLNESNTKKVDAILQDNAQDAGWVGVQSIPSLVIGNAYYPIPAPLEDFNVSQILPLLAQAR